MKKGGGYREALCEERRRIYSERFSVKKRRRMQRGSL